jgi:hypothetical protein
MDQGFASVMHSITCTVRNLVDADEAFRRHCRGSETGRLLFAAELLRPPTSPEYALCDLQYAGS